MPAPAVVGVYVLATVGTVAAGLAFKEFVYEPHIAPRVERWAEEFLAKRRAKKMQRAGLRAIPVPNHSTKRSDDGHNDGHTDAGADNQSTYELESLVANEVRQWRSQVDAGRGEGSGLRHRNVGSSSGSALDESNIIIPYSPLTPTHVLFDPAEGLTVSSPTSTISSRVATPSPHSTLSHSTFRTPPPAVQAPPTPEPSMRGSPISTPIAREPTPDPVDPFLFAASSPHHVPSLSLSHPVDLDAEHDLELLSAPSSSRPASPFSELSSQSHDETYQSFTLSPELAMLSVSEAGSEAGDGDDLERWSNAGSEISGSSWASAGRQ
ncbi:hypothetical protein FB451DRAFT_1370603 [Mycena latifolia]|nr:hypothetical protein FB451DRAFT_1370603 [Mycena latifolia]